MVNSGEIAQGTNVVPTEITTFSFDKLHSTVTEKLSNRNCAHVTILTYTRYVILLIAIG